MVAGASAVALLAAGGYVTADVLDVVPGVLTRDPASALRADAPVDDATLRNAVEEAGYELAN